MNRPNPRKNRVNPYASPTADEQPIPYWRRLRYALRRALKTYRSELQRRQVSPLEHRLTWIAILLLSGVAGIFAIAMIQLLVLRLLGNA